MSLLDHFFAHTPETLAAWCESRRMPKFKAGQILEWVYHKGVIDPEKMTNLSKLERQTLKQEMRFLTGTIVRKQDASDGVRKLLIAWEEDGNGAGPGAEGRGKDIALPLAEASSLGPRPMALIPSARTTECVMIPTDDRATACISSQVGCPVGCKFCASGIGGLEGNLTGGRIVEQVWLLRQRLREELPEAHRIEFPRITNVVFMGMGEPLANFQPVMHAIKCITGLWGHAISARKVTISTVGLPAAIERLAEQCDAPVTLALSLHAPTDELRRTLIPWAEYSTIQQLLASCQKWFDKTGREITLEYTLLRDVNDRPEHASELARLARSLRANVNLIRYNENPGLDFQRPRDADVNTFQKILRDKNVNAHIRASRGRDIAAACGQLRHEARVGKA